MMNPEHLLAEYEPGVHTCTGAECPQCMPEPPLRRAQPYPLHQCRMCHQPVTLFEVAEYQRNGQLITPLCSACCATHEQLTTFSDCLGRPVTRWPDVVLPSCTVIIFTGIIQAARMLSSPPYVLCHQRADNHHWGFVGGAMEIGESILECAKREALEETGLVVENLQLVGVDSDPQRNGIVPYPDRLVHYCNLVFTGSVCSGELQKSSESTALRWCHPDTLPEPFLPAHRWRLQIARIALMQGRWIAVR